DSHIIFSPPLAVLRLRTNAGLQFLSSVRMHHLNGGRGLARGALQTSEKTIQEQKSCSKYVDDDFNSAVGTNCSGDGGSDLMTLVTKLKTENLF
ncbi:hypothetical protein V3C99_011657, partial [Haemonchus contortus]